MTAETPAIPLAQLIFDTLGAGDFAIRAGIKDVLGDDRSLKMRLPAARTTGGGTHLKIEAGGDGLYKVTMFHVDQQKLANPETAPEAVTVLQEVHGVPLSDLPSTFAAVTGITA